nr:MAG TPA: hypothetical protein [Caudoviricetes sp.]
MTARRAGHPPDESRTATGRNSVARTGAVVGSPNRGRPRKSKPQEDNKPCVSSQRNRRA